MRLQLAWLSLAVITTAGCSGKQAAEQPEAPVEKPLRCNPNIGEACDVEGMKYENAVGRPRDLNAAARHYAAACDAGFGAGCTHLAGMFFEKGDSEQSHALYTKACEAGDVEGCANLGFMESRSGNGDRARELYGTACDGGSMIACANLADTHQAGRGVPVDHTKAQALFMKSCAGGESSSCIRAGWSLARGCSKDACKVDVSDEAAAANQALIACGETSEPHVCTTLGVHLEAGRYLPKDVKGARAQFDEACKAGSAWGCDRLGASLSRAGKRDIGITHLLAACEADFASACSSAGAMYLGGEGVERDEAKGKELVEKACKLHESRACNTIRLLDL